MEKKKFDFNIFISPEEIENMTDNEYYEYMMINLKKSKNNIENGKYIYFDDFIKELV